MGFAGISWGSLLLIVLLFFILFGKWKTTNLSDNINTIIKNFKQGLDGKD